MPGYFKDFDSRICVLITSFLKKRSPGPTQDSQPVFTEFSENRLYIKNDNSS